MISIAALIFKSTKFADSTVESLLEFTPHLHDGRARFFFVANDATPNLIEHLNKKGYPYVCQNNKDRSEQELLNLGYAGPSYIHRVYCGWNRAIMESEEQCVLLNSDMQFSPGWLEGLIDNWNPNIILTSTLVERDQPKFGPKDLPNRANYFVERDFGSHPDNFDKNGFYAFSKNISVPGVRNGRHYASIMFSRSKAIEAGLYPEGNLFAPWGIYSGDVVFFNRLASIGVEHKESMSSIVYHYNEGEQEDISMVSQQLKFNTIVSTIDTADYDGEHAQANFSGLYSFSNVNLCTQVADYIQKTFKFSTHVDVGASMGRLSSILLNNGYDSYCIDGTDYGFKHNNICVDKSRYAVIDFSLPTEINSRYDISTCFEVLEHVPENKLTTFFENLQKVSKKSFLSIHIGGQHTENHVTLKPKEFWLNLCSKFGTVKVSEFKIDNEFENSIFLEIDFK